jgi:hypothetical protein
LRDLKIIDAVIQLHQVAKIIEDAIGVGDLSERVRECADKLHDLSLRDSKNHVIVSDIINKAKGQE